jgi:hypothetical protein
VGARAAARNRIGHGRSLPVAPSKARGDENDQARRAMIRVENGSR